MTHDKNNDPIHSTDLINSCDCLQRVSGTVVDKETGRPLHGVTVYNKHKNWNTTTTDTSGHFELTNVSRGFRCPPMTVVSEFYNYIPAEFSIQSGEQCNLALEKILLSNFIDSTCIPNPDTLDGQKVYKFPHKKAEFPSGPDSLQKFLTKSIKKILDNVYEDSVHLTFVIDSTGKIRNVCSYTRFRMDILTPIETECIRVIEAMPYWTPAEINGQRVYSREILPIKFKL